MKIQPGDLVHADRHGIQTIPLSAADAIPDIAAELVRQEQGLIDLCRAPGFSVAKLSAAFARLRGSGMDPATRASSPE